VVLGGRAGTPAPSLRRGKREIVLDLKSGPGRAALHALVRTADVVLEGFRPGAAARSGAGYDELSAVNPRLVYCSVTGYGQDGPWAQSAGHDINYLALGGLLGAMQTPTDPPRPPFNLVGDLAGGGMLAAVGILAALVERNRSGRGQAVDVAMVDGVVSLMAMVTHDWGSAMIPGGEPGLMDGGAPFYRCYRCADGRYLAVGAVEDRFFAAFWTGLGLPLPVPAHMDRRCWPEMTADIAAVLRTRTRDAWTEVFAGSDACVSPVLDPGEAPAHAYHVHRGSFGADGSPAVIPRFSRTPGRARPAPQSDATAAVLGGAGLSDDEIGEVLAAGSGARPDGLVKWPPF
jgi:alpha-methylacyl-CoA racemase